ncbi:RNA polymerase subunit sigma-24 [Adhaeribacter arboris]|uniref:RNA polymerase subunit sigma-24 n=2 Tax=Adhaeribacter arboris TaxID=2072846 RepID=A0A2T2YNX5_9BACT|nr:RNA polymerase subunit sigma-24 [Adhaeribacter arboris]
MYTILFRMLNNEEEAADALQEGFLEVFRSLSSFKAQSSLGAWIKTIVVRAGLKKQRKTLFLEPLEEQVAFRSPIEWDQNLTGEYLDKAIRQLPDGYRNVFLLVEVEGYTHREVADLLNIAEGTSKSQLFQAKKLLQRLLKDVK